MLTNPELLRETLGSNAANLARGMHMLAEDIEAGGGDLKIRQSDAAKFEVGRNLAVTPGKVIYENELMQLIQYAPSTPTVLKTPLLIVPPWINKFYVLDLTPEKSFIKWCVDQGITVFVISWVNPDEKLAHKDFEDYMREGPLPPLMPLSRRPRDQGPHHWLLRRRHAVVDHSRHHGGEERRPRRLGHAVCGASRFTHAGDLKVFVDEEQLKVLEERMAARAAISKARRWPTPSTCCAPTT